MARTAIFRKAELEKLTHGQLLALLLEVNDVLAPIRKCRKATLLASMHGTEWGDDKTFDELYLAVHRTQELMKEKEIKWGFGKCQSR